MILLLVVALAWCTLPLPLAIAMGRIFGAEGHGAVDPTPQEADLAA